jgi:hypothetical protein
MSNVTVCECPPVVSPEQLNVIILTLVCAAATLLSQLMKLPGTLPAFLDLFRSTQKAPVNQVLEKVKEIHAAVTPPGSRSVSLA